MSTRNKFVLRNMIKLHLDKFYKHDFVEIQKRERSWKCEQK